MEPRTLLSPGRTLIHPLLCWDTLSLIVACSKTGRTDSLFALISLLSHCSLMLITACVTGQGLLTVLLLACPFSFSFSIALLPSEMLNTLLFGLSVRLLPLEYKLCGGQIIFLCFVHCSTFSTFSSLALGKYSQLFVECLNELYLSLGNTFFTI